MRTPRAVPDHPLARDDVLVAEDLSSEAQTLGPDSGLRRVREGGVSIGRPRIVPLHADELPETVRRRPGVVGRSFVVAHLPFDLDELAGSRRYRTARFEVTLNVPDAVAHSLWPLSVVTEAEVEASRTFGLQMDLSFGAVDAGPTVDLGRDTTFRFTRLQPVVTAFGVGRPRFHWSFSARPTADLEPGHRSVFVVVDLPAGTRAVTGAFVCEVVVARRRLGVVETVDARTRSVPFRIRLDSGDTTLVQPDDV